MPKKIKPLNSEEKVQPSGQNNKKVSSALTSNGYSNYMQAIILKDVKAQANKIKRDAKKLKEVRALEKANAEKEKARQRKIKEKQEAQKKKIEECRRKYETELHAGRLTIALTTTKQTIVSPSSIAKVNLHFGQFFSYNLPQNRYVFKYPVSNR